MLLKESLYISSICNLNSTMLGKVKVEHEMMISRRDGICI